MGEVGKKPSNAGGTWSELEDNQLKVEFEAGMSIKEISQIHNRTTGAIESRLGKQGIKYNENEEIRDQEESLCLADKLANEDTLNEICEVENSIIYNLKNNRQRFLKGYKITDKDICGYIDHACRLDLAIEKLACRCLSNKEYRIFFKKYFERKSFKEITPCIIEIRKIFWESICKINHLLNENLIEEAKNINKILYGINEKSISNPINEFSKVVFYGYGNSKIHIKTIGKMLSIEKELKDIEKIEADYLKSSMYINKENNAGRDIYEFKIKFHNDKVESDNIEALYIEVANNLDLALDNLASRCLKKRLCNIFCKRFLDRKTLQKIGIEPH